MLEETLQKISPKLFSLLDSEILPASNEKFIAKKQFVEGPETGIIYMSEWFIGGFLSIEEEPQPERTLYRGRLASPSLSDPILKKIGGEEKAKTSLQDFWIKLKAQRDGRAGELITNSGANVFYIPDINNNIRVVAASYLDGWQLCYYKKQHQFEWPVGTIIFYSSEVSCL